jgi:hypothetical protein
MTMLPYLTMLAQDKNSLCFHDLQAYLTPEGYLTVDPYENIQEMVISMRVQGPATPDDVS